MIKAKLMLLGDIGVGKSSLANRLVFDRFDSEYKTTIGVDILSYTLPADGTFLAEETQFTIWDTDGDFGNAIFNSVYIRGASAAIIVADLSRPATIDRMIGLTDRFAEEFPGRPFMVVLNKLDLIDQQSNPTTAFSFHKDRLHFTSAKEGTGVRDVFLQVASELARRQ